MEEAIGREAAAPGATPTRPTVVVKEDACIACGACVDSCPRGAIALRNVAVVDQPLCFGCGICVDSCPSRALELVAG
jgi:Pyruvate/2-oxoacid:ferredoxin oxidoreductase delta subunit